MPTIRHRMHINAPRETVLEALTSATGVARWWSEDTEQLAPNRIAIRFPEGGSSRVSVATDEAGVLWTFLDDPPDGWAGTWILWRCDSEADGVWLEFEHDGWTEAGRYFARCAFLWAASCGA